MLNANTKPAVFVVLFTLLQSGVYIVSGAAIWSLLLAPVVLLFYLYWPAAKPLAVSDGRAEQLAQTADNIT